MSNWRAVARRNSVVNNRRVSFENLLRLAVQFSGHLMDLVLETAGRAAHAHPAALTMNFKLALAFLAFHGASLEKLGSGKKSFKGIAGLGQGLGTTFLALNNRRH
jgi:predicted RNA-binding protein YlxR (DUF448 family)